MAFYSCNANSSSGSGFSSVFDPFSHGLGGFHGVSRGGSVVSDSLVWDSDKGELVKAPARSVKKRISEAKALEALKNHSEAERRRRERINSHLSTLRGLVPFTEKMDKATLLAEVIRQVKELKKKALEASDNIVIPMDRDEVKVERYNSGIKDGPLFFKVTLCCEYQPDLLSDLKHALDTLRLRIAKAEISTFGNRVKNILHVSGCNEENINHVDESQYISESIHQALSSILDKVSSPEYFPRTTLPSKRQRFSSFDTSSSSSGS